MYELLANLPPDYTSPDLTPSDYRLLSHHKKIMDRKYLSSNDEIIEVVDEYLADLQEHETNS